MVNSSRSYGRQVYHLIGSNPQSDKLRHDLVVRQIAYVNALRCHLRRQQPFEDIANFLPDDEIRKLEGVSNIPNAILNRSAELLSEAGKQGWLDSFKRVQIETLLVEMSNAQGGMERIKNTPLPREYGYFPTLFVHFFCRSGWSIR